MIGKVWKAALLSLAMGGFLVCPAAGQATSPSSGDLHSSSTAAEGSENTTVINPTSAAYGYTGGDIGAPISAALNACEKGNCKILIPSRSNGYSMNTAVANRKSGVTFECAEAGTVKLLGNSYSNVVSRADELLFRIKSRASAEAKLLYPYLERIICS